MQKLERLAEEICQREGCELYELEWVSGSKGKGRVLRVYVDRQDQMPSVEDCEKVSRGLSLILDVEDVIPGGEYALEVSTPGMDRRLSRPKHFQKSTGKNIQLKTKENIHDFNSGFENKPKRQNARGRVLDADSEYFTIDVDGTKLKVPYSIVDKAQVIFDYEELKGQKKKY